MGTTTSSFAGHDNLRPCHRHIHSHSQQYNLENNCPCVACQRSSLSFGRTLEPSHSFLHPPDDPSLTTSVLTSTKAELPVIWADGVSGPFLSLFRRSMFEAGVLCWLISSFGSWAQLFLRLVSKLAALPQALVTLGSPSSYLNSLRTWNRIKGINSISKL